MNTLLLSRKDVKQLLSMELAIESVKDAYKMFYHKQIEQPPIMSIDIKKHRGEMDIKSCYSLDNETISVKIASGYWNNPKNYSLPTMIAQIVIFDGKSGYPLCIMDGSLITGYRTGAAGGLSASLLARKSSKSIGVIGAGTQARMQVLAIKSVLDIEDVYVYSKDESQLKKYKEDIESSTDIHVHICYNAEDAVRRKDIIITTTPSTKAIVKKDWITNGMHIIAVGADMAGKQELESDIFKDARIFVDSKA
ncbi:ornithine cyclodeaminase family protein, partial [Clostridiaceae bacterium HSG29]|nr:ornithine cyclodeaminase family protein [Clostridiaceae bacterium HSG29]